MKGMLTKKNIVMTTRIIVVAGFMILGADVAAQVTENYVKTYTARDEGLTDLSSITDESLVNINTLYLDGLGRLKQTVIRKGSPLHKDIVSVVDYDDVGRQHINYLPFSNTHTTPGNVHSNWQTEIENFYNTGSADVADEADYYYSEKQTEPSPLGRVERSFAPGSAWRTADRAIDYVYRPNTLSEAIPWFEVSSNATQDIAYVSDYATGALWLTETVDENLGRTREYKDRSGKLVCKMSEYATNSFAETYYLYDEFDKLTFVIPPQAVANAASAWETELNDPAFRKAGLFRYVYDKRKRMVEKQVPGAEPIYMVYDSRDRLVLTQDGNQRIKDVEHINGNTSLSAYDKDTYLINSGSLTLLPGFTATTDFIASTDPSAIPRDWAFTKYDQYNRPVMTGITTVSGNLEEVQQQVDDFYVSGSFFESFDNVNGLLEDYTNVSFPTHDAFGNELDSDDLLTITYYDKYSFNGVPPQAPVGYNDEVKGLVTGTKTRVLETSEFLVAVNWYDDQYRPIRAYADNHLSGSDVIDTEYFNEVSTNVKKIIRTHTTTGISKTIVSDYTYDHLDRLEAEITTIDGNASTITHEYNEVGQLVEKDLSGAQSVDYSYNIRGWLSKINGGTTFDDPATDKFGMELQYDAAGQYNGNIGKMLWKGVDDFTSTYDDPQSYDFTYDGLNRLKKATYNTSLSNPNHYNVGGDDNGEVRYDANGNIQNLNRYKTLSGTNYMIDNLAYTYTSGNQLAGVVDNGSTTGISDPTDGSITQANHYGFRDDANGSATDYEYDANGNMTSDANKGISNITYNYLNLPERVDFANGSYVAYIYDAMGSKLRKETNTGADIDYIAGIQYTDGAIDFVQHSEGRYDFSGGSYLYDIKDHLGNSRITIDGGALSVSTTSLYQNSSTQQSGFISFSSTAVAQGDELTLTFEAIPSNVMGLAIEMFVSGSTGTQYEVQTDEGTTYTSYHQFTFTFDVTMAGPTNVTFYIHDVGGGGMSIKNISLTKQDVTVSVSQRDDYYPFGGTFNSYTSGTKNNYLYQSKEEQEELETFDFEWRMYDAMLGRTWQIDPHGENFYEWSGYSWAGNNPIIMVDPTGMDWYSYTDDDGNESTIWRDASDESLDIDGNTYNNIGTTYSYRSGDVTYSFEQQNLSTIEEHVLDESDWVSDRPNGTKTQECFDASCQMVAKSGAQAGLNYAENRIVLGGEKLTSQGYGILSTGNGETGQSYIDSQVDQGKSVLLGVDWKYGSVNSDGVTDHWVALASRITNVSTGAVSYRFFDPGTKHAFKGTNPQNVLKLNAGMYKANYYGKVYDLTAVRKNR